MQAFIWLILYKIGKGKIQYLVLKQTVETHVSMQFLSVLSSDCSSLYCLCVSKQTKKHMKMEHQNPYELSVCL